MPSLVRIAPLVLSCTSLLLTAVTFWSYFTINAELGSAYGLRITAFFNSLLYFGYFCSRISRSTAESPTTVPQHQGADAVRWLACFWASFAVHLVLVLVVLVHYPHRIDVNTVGLFIAGTVSAAYLAKVEFGGNQKATAQGWLFTSCWSYLWFLHVLSYVAKSAESVAESQFMPHHWLSAVLYVGVGVYAFAWPKKKHAA